MEEVRRIGNNFNQLIKSFNERKMGTFSKIEIEMLLKSLAEIKEVFFKIQDIATENYLPESRKPLQ
ncbi:plasmid mobilization relaxosome protein MobC [Flavobacterium aquidurense]|uniref:plasmid mobilization relaxosome protein MobC n=1 Tax=Flavobacterium aquidurense TaxID=362413 RepID=UPI003742C80B